MHCRTVAEISPHSASPSTGVTGTWRDPVLTALGQQQAKELANYFCDNNVQLDIIFSSPY